MERHAELGAVRLELLHLGGGHLVGDWQVAWGGGDGVVGGGHRAVGAANLQAAGAKAGERLGAGDLVHEVQVDRQDGGRPLLLIDNVLVPDLLNNGLRHRASLPEGETHPRPLSHHFNTRWMRADQARSLWSCPGNGVVSTSVPNCQPRAARSASNAA